MSSELTIGESLRIEEQGLSFYLDLEHIWEADLSIDLVSPTETEVEIFSFTQGDDVYLGFAVDDYPASESLENFVGDRQRGPGVSLLKFNWQRMPAVLADGAYGAKCAWQYQPELPCHS